MLDDQVRLGQMLVRHSIAIALGWFAHLLLVLMRKVGAVALPPELPAGASAIAEGLTAPGP